MFKPRTLAVSVMLARGGYSLNLFNLKKLKWKVLKIAFIPALTEAVVFGVVSHFVLKMPILWTIQSGFIYLI